MLTRRSTVGLLTAAALATSGGIAQAKNPHHKSGHDLLGAKLKQNGHHQIDKAGNVTVSADVANGKVTSMSAVDGQGKNLPPRKIKSQKKMAHLQQGEVQVASADERIQLAQADYYYGWVFDTGADEYFYWYPASDVVVEETWIEYTG